MVCREQYLVTYSIDKNSYPVIYDLIECRGCVFLSLSIDGRVGPRILWCWLRSSLLSARRVKIPLWENFMKDSGK